MPEDLAFPPALRRPPQFSQADTGDDGLTWLPAWRLRELIARREVSPVEVTEHFLARIEAFDPVLHAFREIDYAGAREQARRAEQAVLSGEALGSLHGVPLALKEHIPIAGITWHDLAADTKSAPPRDAIEVERLRAEGAIIVGSLIAQGGNPSPATEPRNPWDIARTPGGSSLGSASATAGGLLPGAICTDGRGSTRLPAAFSGVVGMRATRGRVPSIHDGTMSPVMLTDSSAMTRDVRDAALITQAMAGPDGRDLACLQSEAPDYLALIGRDVAGMRLAWTGDFGYAGAYAAAETADVIAAVRRAALDLAGAGAAVDAVDDVWEDPDFATWVVHVASPVMNERVRGQLLQGGRMTADAGSRAQQARQRIWTQYREMLGRYDFILSPTIHFTAPTVEDWISGFRQPDFMANYTAYTSAANLLGWPAISLPAGFVGGMPVGLQIMGLPDSEPRMFQLAQAFMALRA